MKENLQTKVFSVSELARGIRSHLEIEFHQVCVEGEVSNLTKQASGHLYFSLKDEESQISCAFFRAPKIEWTDGSLIRVKGKMSFYVARGTAQLIVKEVENAGLGFLQKKFEELKEKLRREGLFSSEHKNQIPPYPQKIAIITSKNAAALRDITQVLKRRCPWIQTYLYPVSVQGEGTWKQTCLAIEKLNRSKIYGLPKVDVLILARGGGSLEDLWNFNEEGLARSIFASQIPIITGIGHEIDFTLADFVADMRAATPSAAAELVSISQKELQNQLYSFSQKAKHLMLSQFEKENTRLQISSQSLRSFAIKGALKNQQTELKQYALRLSQVFCLYQERKIFLLENLKNRLISPQKRWESYQNRWKQCQAILKALSPRHLLEKGFSIVFQNHQNQNKQKVVSRLSQVKKEDLLKIQVSDGTLAVKVLEKKKKTRF